MHSIGPHPRLDGSLLTHKLKDEAYMAQKKKLTLYFPEDILNETKAEALRQDRSLSWILQMAWMMSREKIHDLPGIDDLKDDARHVS